MKKQGKTGMVGCAGFAMVAMALAGAPAFAADPGATSTSTSRDMSGSKPSITQTVHATVTVTAIDKDTRELTVKKADGSKATFQVPTEVAMFDKLKVGDKVDIDYGESLAVEMLPPGSKPSQSEQVARAPGMAGREMTVSAEVVAVDPASNHVTFKGPSGNVETIAVRDPAMQQKLPNVKPGQVIQFTYTQAIIGAIQPHSKK